MKIQNAPSGYSEILESIYDNYSQWVVANIKKIKSERDVLPILLDFSGAKAETEEIAMALARKLGLKIYVGEFSFTSFFGLSNNLGWQSLIPKSFAGNRL